MASTRFTLISNTGNAIITDVFAAAKRSPVICTEWRTFKRDTYKFKCSVGQNQLTALAQYLNGGAVPTTDREIILASKELECVLFQEGESTSTIVTHYKEYIEAGIVESKIEIELASRVISGHSSQVAPLPVPALVRIANYGKLNCHTLLTLLEEAYKVHGPVATIIGWKFEEPQMIDNLNDAEKQRLGTLMGKAYDRDILIQRYAEIRTQIEDMKHEIGEHQKTRTKLLADLAKLKGGNSGTAIDEFLNDVQTLVTYQEENERLRKVVAEKDKRIEDLLQTIDFQGQIAKLQGQVRDLQLEEARAKTAAEHEKAAKVAAEDRFKQVSERFNEANVTIQKLQDRLDVKEQTISNLRDSQTSLVRDRTEAVDTAKTHESTVQQLSTHSKTVVDENIRLRQQISAYAAAHPDAGPVQARFDPARGERGGHLIEYNAALPLTGIIAHLTTPPSDYVSVSTNAPSKKYPAINILNTADDVYFCTTGTQNASITFDFSGYSVHLLQYTLKSGKGYFPRNWVVQGSNNNLVWDTLDQQEGVTFGGIHTNKDFKCNARPKNEKSYRYIQITQKKQNHEGTYFFMLSRVEFFGHLHS